MNLNNAAILYSLRNCPFAIRARMAILSAKQRVILRNIVLTDKPQEFLLTSPKSTVPVLQLPSKKVIDESLQIMLWALQENDPNDLLHSTVANAQTDMLAIIDDFDLHFKVKLENYKCAKRYHESSLIAYRQACEQHIQYLEQALTQHKFIFSNRESLVDLALLPFIRQFARVERQWYLQAPYPHVRNWLNRYLQSPTFTKVMTKYPLWVADEPEVYFPDR